MVTLFTNIPTNLAIEIARRPLENEDTLEERTEMDVSIITRVMPECHLVGDPL